MKRNLLMLASGCFVIILAIVVYQNTRTIPLDGKMYVVVEEKADLKNQILWQNIVYTFNQQSDQVIGNMSQAHEFKSSDETILTIDEQGIMEGISEGSASITFKIGNNKFAFSTIFVVNSSSDI